MEKIKIAFYIESMVVGGAEKVLIDLVNHLDPLKYDVTVVSIFAQSVYEGYKFEFEENFQKNIHYKTLIDNSKRWKYILFNYCYAHLPKKWIHRLFIKEKYDIEVAFYEGFPTIFVANSSNNDSKKVAWLHTNQKRLYEKKTQEELNEVLELYKKYNKIIGVSKEVVGSFRECFPLPQLEYCYNLLDEEAIQEKAKEISNLPIDKKKINLVTVGRLIEIKGYERLLASIKNLNNEKIHLWMIGDGTLAKKLKDYVEKNELSKHVTFLGHQSNPYKYLKEMDYLVCSSFQEGLSTVVIEALILGIPVITTNCSGMKEIFGDSECGIICENSQEGIETALHTILDKSYEYRKYRNEAKKRGNYFYKSNRMKEIEKILDN